MTCLLRQIPDDGGGTSESVHAYAYHRLCPYADGV